MKIAVTYENGEIFQHFGHTETFKVYDVEDGKVVSAEVVETNGSGHGALAGRLNEISVDVLICGGIGMGAQMALQEAGIKLFGGVSGDADEAVNAFYRTVLIIILMLNVTITDTITDIRAVHMAVVQVVVINPVWKL